MQIKEFDIPLTWGSLRGQIFGERSPKSRPIIALHGYLDNSNSFIPLAEYLTSNKDYFIISVDLPGHGFSSNLPTGVYIPKLFVIAIRRLIKYFNFNSVIFLTHSYGSNIALLYGTIFNDEVDALVLIDFTLFTDKPLDAESWKEGIDTLINFQYEINNKYNNKNKESLTRDLALKRLLSVNEAIDEKSANIMLDRGLIDKDGYLEYARDICAKQQMLLPDHYSDLHLVKNNFHKYCKAPILFLHSVPFFARIGGLQFTCEFLKMSKGHTECIGIEGTHFFHMMLPEKTSKIILDFLKNNLKNINTNVPSKL